MAINITHKKINLSKNTYPEITYNYSNIITNKVL